VHDIEPSAPRVAPESPCTGNVARATNPPHTMRSRPSRLDRIQQRSLPVKETGVYAVAVSIEAAGQRGNDARDARSFGLARTQDVQDIVGHRSTRFEASRCIGHRQLLLLKQMLAARLSFVKTIISAVRP
jgi:hypothetical protein